MTHADNAESDAGLLAAIWDEWNRPEHDASCPGDEKYCALHCPVPAHANMTLDGIAEAAARAVTSAIRSEGEARHKAMQDMNTDAGIVCEHEEGDHCWHSHDDGCGGCALIGYANGSRVLPPASPKDAGRCPYVSTDPITTSRPREDGWRCGESADRRHNHTLYTADGERVLYSSGWALPSDTSPEAGTP